MLLETSIWAGIAQSLIAAGSGLLGVAIGGLISARNQSTERKTARLREQLEQFYSPLLGMRSEIMAKSQTRLKINMAADSAWVENFDRVTDPDVKRRITEENAPAFDKLQEYNEAQLREELVPLYCKMLAHFSSHMWLAERSTQRNYDVLCEFVEIWKRAIDKSLPAAVVRKIEHEEKKLYPFYNDLQDHFDRLVEELKK